jgi:hypothetical protein
MHRNPPTTKEHGDAGRNLYAAIRSGDGAGAFNFEGTNTQSFWRNLISAIADGRQRKADEYVKEYLERHAEDEERRR